MYPQASNHDDHLLLNTPMEDPSVDVAELLLEFTGFEGLSLEWVFDRIEQSGKAEYATPS